MIENPQDLVKIANFKMPFGRYAGRALIDLPEAYVNWFNNNGYPEGELGRLLSILYYVKLNGLEALFKPLRGSDEKIITNLKEKGWSPQ
ncbi:MAG: DUF3820 family protein [Pseudomonadota bacterium]